MSAQELDRITVFTQLAERRLRQREAAAMLGLCTRQVRRLSRVFAAQGPVGLTSRRRGRPSNRRLPAELRRQALALVQAHYRGFGPTLAHEKLTEQHGLRLSVETLRQWMIEAGLWQTRYDRAPRVHQPRQRRAAVGELVQIDGCEHDWFEGRGAGNCTLLVFVDDATGRLQELRFVESESAHSYFESTQRYLETHGRPVAFYSDKHGIFRVNAKEPHGGDGFTQFGRALRELDIELICAHSPQAKGRVERANLTLQDRLVKELRLRGISNMDDGNRFLPEFMADYNRRFGKEPLSPHDVHRPLRPTDDLGRFLCWQEERRLTSNLVVHYKRVMYLVESTPETLKLRGKRVTVYEDGRGEVTIRHRDQVLTAVPVPKENHVSQGAVVDNKHLGAVLATVQEMQRQQDSERLKAKRGLTLREKERLREHMDSLPPPPPVDPPPKRHRNARPPATQMIEQALAALRRQPPSTP